VKVRGRSFALLLGTALLSPILVGACSGDDPVSPAVYGVVYSLDLSGGPTRWDSVKYDNGQGVLEKVSNPPLNWSVEIPVTEGGSTEAHAWGPVPFGSLATLTVTWAATGKPGGTDEDAVTNTKQGTTIEGTLTIGKRTI
jgi:hypothetical protein